MDEKIKTQNPTPKWGLFIATNIIGGIAVLGSYVHGAMTKPDIVGGLWGGVPESAQPIYTANMFFAAAGYFLFSYYIYFQLRKKPGLKVFGRPGHGVFLGLILGILVPSAMWMPLTLVMIVTPSMGLWILICAVLGTVGLSSVALIAALLKAEPRGGSTARILAVVGAIFFSIQTALLDGIIWTLSYPVP